MLSLRELCVKKDDLKFAFLKLRVHLSLCMYMGCAADNVKHCRDQSWFFSKYQLSRFFWGDVFSNDFVLNKAILLMIKEQILHIKIGRIFITWATAYVESFCQHHARKQVIQIACSSFVYRQLLKKLLVQQSNTFHILDDNAVCVLFSINLEFQKRSKPQLSRKQ